MICEKCGNKLNEKASFCPNCGTKVEEKKVEKVEEKQETPTVNTANNGTTNVVNDSDKKLSTTLTVISIICHYGVTMAVEFFGTLLLPKTNNILNFILDTLLFGSYLASYVLVIMAIIKGKKYSFPIIILIIYILEIFVIIITLLLVFSFCEYVIKSVG